MLGPVLVDPPRAAFIRRGEESGGASFIPDASRLSACGSGAVPPPSMRINSNSNLDHTCVLVSLKDP